MNPGYVDPKPTEVRWIHDAFGNCITLLDFAAKTPVLQFETFIRLDHTPENAPDYRIEDYARIHPFSYAEEEYPDLLPYIQRQYPEEKSVEQRLTRFVMPKVRHPTGQLLMTLNQAIAQSFSYKRRTERGTQSPDETIHYQEGTCRDFALLSCCRPACFSKEELYGRESEINALLTAFDRVVAHGTPELVLVSGYSGVDRNACKRSREDGRAMSPFGTWRRFPAKQQDVGYRGIADSGAVSGRQIYRFTA